MILSNDYLKRDASESDVKRKIASASTFCCLPLSQLLCQYFNSAIMVFLGFSPSQMLKTNEMTKDLQFN
jgi:hypothetical protein